MIIFYDPQTKLVSRYLDGSEPGTVSYPGLDELVTDEYLTPDFLRTAYVDGQTVKARPSLNVPTALALEVGEDYSPQGIPNGTLVLIDGDEAGVTHGGLILSFPAAGLWHVRLEPPLPHLPADFEVTVT